MKNRLNLVGKTFHRLTVIKDLGQHPKRGSYWECVCSCDLKTVVRVKGVWLTSGNTQSCGCLQRERTSKASRTHGFCKAPGYNVWLSMMHRCYLQSTDSYPRYGGRGIQVCERWHSIENFLEDVGERPNNQYSIDRIDPNGNYEPNNCRWATKKQQQRNRRDTRMLTWQGKTQALADWGEELGIEYEALRRRFDKGWSTERALSTPYVSLKKPMTTNWVVRQDLGLYDAD